MYSKRSVFLTLITVLVNCGFMWNPPALLPPEKLRVNMGISTSARGTVGHGLKRADAGIGVLYTIIPQLQVGAEFSGGVLSALVSNGILAPKNLYASKTLLLGQASITSMLRLQFQATESIHLGLSGYLGYTKRYGPQLSDGGASIALDLLALFSLTQWAQLYFVPKFDLRPDTSVGFATNVGTDFSFEAWHLLTQVSIGSYNIRKNIVDQLEHTYMVGFGYQI